MDCSYEELAEYYKKAIPEQAKAEAVNILYYNSGWTVENIALALSKSQQWVRERIDIILRKEGIIITRRT